MFHSIPSSLLFVQMIGQSLPPSPPPHQGYVRPFHSLLFMRFFIFLFFNFVFYKNIFFLKFIEIYPGRPAVGRPAPGRPAAGRQEFFCETFRKKFAPGSLRTGRPAAGRPAPQAVQLRGDRLPLHYIRVWLPPHPSFASLKIQKKEREEGGREAKPCRIFEPATAGNQNSSTLYK